EGEEPLEATFRLHRNVWNGAVEPRLVLRHAQPCQPLPIHIAGEPEDYLGAVLAELEQGLEPPPAGLQDGRTAANERAATLRTGGLPTRTVLDRRGESPLAILADATCDGGGALA